MIIFYFHFRFFFSFIIHINVAHSILSSFFLSLLQRAPCNSAFIARFNAEFRYLHQRMFYVPDIFFSELDRWTSFSFPACIANDIANIRQSLPVENNTGFNTLLAHLKNVGNLKMGLKM